MRFSNFPIFKVLWVLVIISLTTSCIDEPVKKQEDSQFFDLTVFIEDQIALLDSLNPSVKKKVQVEDTYEEKTISNVNWEKELALFTQADISKPAVANTYQVENLSNKVRIYKPKTDENPTVQYLKVDYDQATNQIMALEAVIVQSNYLYHSEKKIQLKTRQSSGKPLMIESYRVFGYQKLIFNDKEPFEITAQVL